MQMAPYEPKTPIVKKMIATMDDVISGLKDGSIPIAEANAVVRAAGALRGFCDFDLKEHLAASRLIASEAKVIEHSGAERAKLAKEAA